MVAVVLVSNGLIADDLERLLKTAGWAPCRLHNAEHDGELDGRLDGQLRAALAAQARKPARRTALIATVDLLEVARALGQARRREMGRVQQICDLELDRGAHQLRHGEKTVSLTPCEYRVFACLARRPGHTVSRTHILNDLARRSRSVSKNMVDVYVLYIRRKLATLECSCSIRTIRGVGYALTEEQLTGVTTNGGSLASVVSSHREG